MWFDDRLQHYNKVAEEVEQLQTVKDQECIRLSMTQLAGSIVNHAKQWESVLGKVLRDSAKENLFNLRDMLDVSFIIFYDYFLPLRSYIPTIFSVE